MKRAGIKVVESPAEMGSTMLKSLKGGKKQSTRRPVKKNARPIVKKKTKAKTKTGRPVKKSVKRR